MNAARRAPFLAAVAAVAISSVVRAAGGVHPSPVIRSAWVRPTQAGGNTAGYLQIDNRGGDPDTLLGATCSCATSVSIHQSRIVGGVMTMRPVDRLPIASGAIVTLSPGGLHLMIEGLRVSLHNGDHVTGTLIFAKAGKRAAEFLVSAGPRVATPATMKM